MLREYEVQLTNEFALPLRVSPFDVPPEVAEKFFVSAFLLRPSVAVSRLVSQSRVQATNIVDQVSDLWEGVLAAGSSGVVARLRLRHWDAQLSLEATLTLQTNVTRYTLPLAVYSGYLEVVCLFLGYNLYQCISYAFYSNIKNF